MDFTYSFIDAPLRIEKATAKFNTPSNHPPKPTSSNEDEEKSNSDDVEEPDSDKENDLTRDDDEADQKKKKRSEPLQHVYAVGMGVPSSFEGNTFLKDRGGHIIARSLGGTDCLYNTFGQGIVSNEHEGSQWNMAEKCAISLQKADCQFEVEILFNYGKLDDALSPNVFSIEWKEFQDAAPNRPLWGTYTIVLIKSNTDKCKSLHAAGCGKKFKFLNLPTFSQ